MMWTCTLEMMLFSEKVHTFCYFRDMLSSDGGCDHAVSAWMEMAKNDLRSLGLNREDAQDRDLWRSVIHGRQADLGVI